MINEIINDDARVAIKHVDGGSVDLIVLDPFFDQWKDFYCMFDDCTRVLKDDGVLIAFSNRPHTGYLQVELDKHLKFLTEIVWNFSDGRWISNNLPRICHENILIYTKATKNVLNDMRLLEWIVKPKPTKKGGAHIGKWEARNRFYAPQDLAQVESVIYQPRGVGKKGGITAKPDELVKLLIEMASAEGDTVLDAFSGVGTIARVAKSLGRNFIGFEIEKNKTVF